MKLTALVRVIGILLIVTGILVFFLGGQPIHWEIDSFQFVLPLDVGLLIVGGILVALPALPLYLVAFFMKGDLQQRFLKWVDGPAVSAEAFSDPNDSSSLPRFLKTELLRIHKRYYVTLSGILLGAALVFGIAVPRIVQQYVEGREFRESGEDLVDLVQEIRIDYSSADTVRRQLRVAREPVRQYPESDTAALYSLLETLYSNEIRSQSDFTAMIGRVYQEKLGPLLAADSGLVKLQALEALSQRSWLECPGVDVTYLTLLATVANEEGDQGRHWVPYMNAELLLRFALQSPDMHGHDLASTYNALGVALAGQLRNHEHVLAKFNKVVGASVSPVSVATPHPVSLAKDAAFYYGKAVDAANSNFLRARYLNNRSDLIMLLLRMEYIDGVELKASRGSDDAFLREAVGLAADGRVSPKHLKNMLEQLESDLSEAVRLSRDPSIFFTRAQLYSLAGVLGEKGPLVGGPWREEEWLRSAAVEDLKTAVRLNIPRKLLRPGRARELHLEWLRQSEEVASILDSLSAAEPPGLAP